MAVAAGVADPPPLGAGVTGFVELPDEGMVAMLVDGVDSAVDGGDPPDDCGVAGVLD